MTAENRSARCVIAGGGPAGMMLGLLLARAKIDVIVVEKHADFLRDFRGDTIHPSTLEVLHELGLLDAFLKLPHQQVPKLNARVGDITVTLADFSHLPVHCRFIAMIPQWDFLDFLADHAALYPGFRLMMKTEVTDLIEESGRVAGVRAATASGLIDIRADLVVAADGRNSVIRDKAGLPVKDFGAPMDVLWFRLSRKPDDPDQTMGRFDVGRIFVSINRGDYWQCGFVIPKGQVEEVRRRGLSAFRNSVAHLAPYAKDRVQELGDWDQIELLTVRVDRLLRWYRPGLLFIGDAAHAMSPVGGVGINLAIQDAVAAGNILAAPLRDGRISVEHLRRVQKRREFPTRVTQRLQIAMQRRVIVRVLDETKPFKPPMILRLIGKFPFLQRIPARLIGYGVRPEHVQISED
jgi:2-polyprenyl-6-methoxyphenol hydroxylase-like FAD-dependent oxidoreductase